MVSPYDRYTCTYNPYKWHCKWETGVMTLLTGVVTPLYSWLGPTLYALRINMLNPPKMDAWLGSDVFPFLP